MLCFYFILSLTDCCDTRWSRETIYYITLVHTCKYVSNCFMWWKLDNRKITSLNWSKTIFNYHNTFSMSEQPNIIIIYTCWIYGIAVTSRNANFINIIWSRLRLFDTYYYVLRYAKLKCLFKFFNYLISHAAICIWDDGGSC